MMIMLIVVIAEQSESLQKQELDNEQLKIAKLSYYRMLEGDMDAVNAFHGE